MPGPIVSVAEMREWESRTWAAGVRESQVIAKVGEAIAQWLIQSVRPGTRLLFLIGPGNNGADARAAMDALSGEDYHLQSLEVQEPSKAYAQLEKYFKNPPDCLVDGIFGIGLSRPLGSDWIKLIEAINEFRKPVISLDCPSGMDADTGEVKPVAVEARWTLAIGAAKMGLIQPMATDWTGRLIVLEGIGLHPEGPVAHSQIRWVSEVDFESSPKEFLRHAGGHKGNFGHTGIVAGSVGYHGAAVLAARAAQVARPGLISVMTIGEAYVPVASNLLSPMVHRFSRETFDKVFEKATALLIGPGLATSESRNYVYPLLQELWRTADVPMVVDASALDWIPQGDVDSEAMRVITPHAGEASRLLHRGGDMEATPNSNRLHAAEALSKMYGHCTVVLKGYQTVTFSPAHHQWFINSSGNPYLAQGGAGDVLAGLITGYLAHPASRLDRNLSLHQIIYAVWLHGWTADVLDQEGCAWTVEDLSDRLKEFAH